MNCPVIAQRLTETLKSCHPAYRFLRPLPANLGEMRRRYKECDKDIPNHAWMTALGAEQHLGPLSARERPWAALLSYGLACHC